MNDQFYSAKDAARILGCTPRTIERLAKKHTVGQKVGRVLLFRSLDLAVLRMRHKAWHRFQAGNEMWKKRKSRNPYRGDSA
jgi:hypothetical protein